MKKFLSLIILVLCMGNVYAIDDARYFVETEVLTFACSTSAREDTVKAGDTAHCVIVQTENQGIIPNQTSLMLPGVLASGDTLKVWLREITNVVNGSTKNLARNTTSINKGNSGVSAENIRAKFADSNPYKYFDHLLGNYSYAAGTLGATKFTWSSPDSVVSPRIEIMLVRTTGTPKVTGMDSLSTSNIILQKLYVK